MTTVLVKMRLKTNSSNLAWQHVVRVCGCVSVPDCKRSKCPRIRIHVRVTQPDACGTKIGRHAVLPAKLVCVTENDLNLN